MKLKFLKIVSLFLVVMLNAQLKENTFYKVSKISDGDTFYVKTENSEKFKIRLIGIDALTSLLCLIYKEKGYYISWNKDTLFDIAQEACCEEEEMQAIIDDCLAVGLFDDLIYKEYGVLTSQAIQEQYHKIITDSRRKYKLPLEHFWLIKEDFKDVTESHDFATTMPQTKEETDTDIKGKQEMDMENEIKSEIKKDKETERQGKCQKENERIMPPVPSNSVFQASPVVVEGLSLDKSIGREKTESTAETVSETASGTAPGTVLETAPKTISEGMQTGGGSEAILLLNMQTIGIRNEQTVKAIAALAKYPEASRNPIPRNKIKI
jgi:hypothetical protein